MPPVFRAPTGPYPVPLLRQRRPFAASARLLALLAVAALAFLLGALRSAEADWRAMRPGDARSGMLLLKAVEEGGYVPAPIVGTDIDITVSGPVARARVTQHFYNPSDGWVEGVYVYPLPDESAVDTMKMVIGDRVVIGEIKERQTAKAIYEKAKAEGKKAALLEQERPNLFTNSVANIGPGETVVVQIEYQQTVPQSDSSFSLRVPLVVAPRFNPEPLVQTVDFGGEGGWGQLSDPVPDRSRIEPPVLNPAEAPPSNPVTLTVRLNAGFPLGEVKSHHHEVKIKKSDEETRIVRIDGVVPADRDFELTWSPRQGDAPGAGLFQERVSGKDYVLAFLTPPVPEKPKQPEPRDVIFVIDNSGSMSGSSIVQAKASLTYALKKLRPEDRFNIVRFDDTVERLFTAAVPADMEHVGQALTFVKWLQADGGTMMVPAMEAALADSNPGDTDRLRQVIFLTDGAIGDEAQLFDTVAAGLGRSRVFMVGIGSAPNSYLMHHAAEIGRGSVTHIGSAQQVESRMRELFDKLARPAVTDLRVDFSNGAGDVTPEVLPDLYAGEALRITARVDRLSGTAKISGMIGDQPWSVSLPLEHAVEAKGISKLWAREKIADQEVNRSLQRVWTPETDQRILALALEHGLVSRLTSLVAVEQTPSRPDGQRLSRADIPLNLPAGWDFEKVFGKPQFDADGPDMDDAGALRAKAIKASYEERIAVSHDPASAQANASQSVAQVQLPKTGTSGMLQLIVGALLLGGSALLLIARHYAGAGRPS